MHSGRTSFLDGVKTLVRGILARRWVRFGIVGGSASVTYALLGLFLVNICALPALAGNALAYVLSFIVSYLGQCLWTFRAAGAEVGAACHRVMLPRFAATQAVGLGFNTAIVWVLMLLGLRYELAMPIALLTVPVLVYVLCKYWVFKTGVLPAAAQQTMTQPAVTQPSPPSDPSNKE